MNSPESVSTEPQKFGWWVLADFGDVVVHVLQPEARDFYGLDELYAECPKVEWEKVEFPELPAEKV